jgi:hypothetical protein
LARWYGGRIERAGGEIPERTTVTKDGESQPALQQH